MSVSPETVLASLPAFSTHVTSTLGRSPHTAKAYVSDVRCLARFLRHPSAVSAAGVATELATAFVAWLRVDERNGPATIKRKLAALSIYFDWRVRIGALETSLFDDSGVEIRMPKRLPRAMPRHDVVRLLQSCKPYSKQIDRDTDLALRLLVATGVRISELCGIDIADIAPDGSAIRIKGKGSRERMVFVSNLDLQNLLKSTRDLKSHTEGIDRSFFLSRRNMRLSPQAFRLRLHRLRASSGLAARITPHCLRHTAATLLLEAGVDIRFVQRLLGHASISTTEIYTRVVDESLKNALLKADPLRDI